MINVVRKDGETSAKVIQAFTKRVRKYNTVARARKTKYFSKPLSHQKKKMKAIQTAVILAERANQF